MYWFCNDVIFYVNDDVLHFQKYQKFKKIFHEINLSSLVVTSKVMVLVTQKLHLLSTIKFKNSVT